MKRELKVIIICIIILVLMIPSREGMESPEATLTELLKKENSCVSGIKRSEGRCVDKEGKEVEDEVEQLMESQCCKRETNRWVKK